MSSDHTSIVSDEQQPRSHENCVRLQITRTNLHLFHQRDGRMVTEQTYAQNQRLQQRERETDNGINGIIDVQPKPRDAAAKLQTKSQETEKSLVTTESPPLFHTNTNTLNPSGLT